jgi:flagellar biosynthetic protein FlhB
VSSEESGQERTEEATPKKLEDARKKGQVARSRELSTMLVTISGAASLLMFGSYIGNRITSIMVQGLSPSVLANTPTTELPSVFFGFLVTGLVAVWPLMALCFLAAIVSSTVLGGMTFSLSFKAERLDPIKGIGKLFSQESLVELVKSILKVLVIGSSAIVVLMMVTDSLLGLGRMVPERAITDSIGMLGWFFLMVSLPLVLIALVDVPWQLYSHHKQLRMTKQEVKDEMKQSDGSPEMKAKVRQLQQEASRRRMMQAVPEADVIITNPTHFAVALKYDESRGAAPIVLAKGMDEVALRIRELAKSHDVLIVESPRLARAVYASTEIDAEIPAGLYLAVAQVLTYVYQLRQWHVQGGEYPDAPMPEVDDEYLTGVAAMPPDEKV